MAKRIVDEEMKFDIIINGNNAQKELFALEKSTRKLTEENKQLSLQKKRMERDGLQETEAYKVLTKAIRDNNKEIKENKGKMAELRTQIGLLGLTMNQLGAEASRLKLQLRNMTPGSADYQKFKKELDDVNARIAELNGKAKDSKLSLSSMADSFNKYAALGASFLAFLTGVVVSLQKVIDWNGKLAAAQTNVMKTTGMTRREVDALTKSFGLLKTRTARMELLKIAEIGGRLGIAKEEIADFVKVMDKSGVALGDSFEGGPDVVADKLGKIKGLYDELKNAGVEQAFEAVGSALNDLGADGLASESNLAEFAARVGTLPGALKPSVAQALGLGAAFEESGLKAEIAGNNYGKLISIAARDIGNFATVMRRPRKELEELINTDPTEFFLQFAQSLKGLDATQLAQVLDYLKLNDNEVKMVLGAASENVDLFREKIQLAGQSMTEATSLTEEYDLKNKGLDATLDRLKKKVMGWFTSDSVIAFLVAAVDGLAKLIGAVEDNDGAMSGFRNTIVFTAKVMAILVTGFISYTAAAKLAALWSTNVKNAISLSNIVFRIQYAQLILQETATKGLALAQALLSFNVTRVKTAYQALTVAMGVNPFGALLAVIGAVIAAFAVFSDAATKNADVIKGVAEVQKVMADQTAKVKGKVSDLVKTIKDENATYDQKKRALEQLQKVANGYLDGLTAENIATAEGERLINRYISSIDRLAKAKAMVNVKAKLEEQKLESDAKILGLSMEQKENQNEGWIGTRGEGDDGKLFGLGSRNKVEIQSDINDEKERRKLIEYQQKAVTSQREKEVKNLQTSIAMLNGMLLNAKKDSDKYKSIMQDIKTNQDALDILMGLQEADTTAAAVNSAYVPPVKDKAAEKAAAKAKKEREEFLKARAKERDDLKKYQEEVNDLYEKGIDERLDMMQEGFDKEEAQEAEYHRRKLDALKKQMISEADIESLSLEIDSDKYSPAQKAVLMHTQQTWIDKNKHLSNLIELEYASHKTKVETIGLRADEKRIQDLQIAFDKEVMVRETAHNNELAALGTNEQAKQRLQDKFDAEQLDAQMEHLQKMLAEKEKIAAGKNNWFDLDFLTPEQRQDLDRQIAELKLKISEILKAKNELAGKGGTNDAKDAFKLAFGDADVLGFTADQWGKTFASLDTLSEKLMAAKMVVGALQNIWGSYNDYVAANEAAGLRKYEKNLDLRKRRLKMQLDNGYINQIQYKRGIEELDIELENKKADIEYKQAKRQKAMAAMNILVNTAQAIMGIWAQVPKYDFGVSAGVLTGIVGAIGALQLAAVMKTPLPAKGYEQGLYPEYVQREQDGKIFKSTYGGKTKSGMVSKPTYFLAGENGPEMVIDKQAYRDLSPGTRYALENELRRIKGFEGGLYNNNLKRFEVPAANMAAAPGQSSDAINMAIVAALNRNSEILEKIVAQGVNAYWNKDWRDLQKLKEDMDRLTNSKLKAKQ